MLTASRSTSHGGLNDVTSHVSGAVHKQWLQNTAGSISLTILTREAMISQNCFCIIKKLANTC